MYNKKTLSKASAELDKAKAPKKPKDIITDPMGQWKYPGLPTRIPSNDITMKGVGYPVLGVANNGQRKIMLPGADYTFPGADYVDEYPQMRKGGAKKKKTKSLSGTNKLMLTHPLLRNYKNKVYDPNVDYFQDGGMKTVKSKDGTVTNRFINEAGDEVVQVKTKDGKYFEKVIPNNKYISPLTGKPYAPMQGDATIPSGWEAEDNTLEDISEFIDPTGITSWDDVRRAYDENGLFDPKTGLEILGALPLVGKIGKSGKILAGGEKLFLDAVKYFGYNDKIENAYKAYRKFGGKNLDDVLGLTTKGLTKLSPKLNPEKWESSMKLINGLNKFTEGAKATKLLPYTPSGDTQTKNDEDYIEAELTDDEIEEYRKGGYIVEDISVPELNQAQKGKTVKNKVLEISDPKEFAYRKALYDDSLQLHKQALKQTNFGLKPISKEKYEEIGNWEHQQPDYVFADKEYKKDLKNKKIKDFDDYVFDIKDPKNKKRTDEHLKQYANNVEDFAITLSDGSIKTPGFIYNGKPDFEYYDLYNPKTGTLKSYAGKELLFIDNDNMKPEKILYYGADKPDYSSVISTESVSKEYTNKVLKNSKSKNKKYVSPHWMSSQTSFYKKPTQPVKFNKNAEKPVVIDRETVTNEPIVNKSKTGDSKVINKINTNNYPEGYQPYSLYGRVLDPEVYGYAKSINGKPVEAAQFGDTYGYKAKMDEYKKSGKYPWVKQEGGLIEAQKGIISTKEHTDKKGNKTIKVQKEDGTVYTKVIGKDGKVYNRTFDPKKDSWATDQTKDLYSKPQGAGNYADEFFTEAALLPGTVKGVKAAAPLVKQGLKTLMTAAPAWAPGANLGNFLTAAGGVMGVNEYVDSNSDVRKSYSKVAKDPTLENVGDAALETGLNMLNFSGLNVGKNLKNASKYATKVADKVAHGETILPYAWKSRAQGVTSDQAQELYQAIKNKKPLTEWQHAMIRDYAFDSSPYTGRWGNVDEVLRSKLNNLIKKTGIDVPENTVLIRRINAEDPKLFNLKNKVADFGDRPVSFSAGRGADYNGPKDRIVLSGRNAKKASKNFIKNEHYTDYSDDVLNKIPEDLRASYKSLPELVLQERELIGTDLNLRKIGKVKNELGGHDYIMKPKGKFFKEGGVVAELSDDEIQDYINQGYIVEEVDEPKMQAGGESDLDSQIEAYKQKLELIKSRRAQNPIQETVVETPVKAAAVPVPSSNSVVQQVVVKKPVLKQPIIKETVKPKKENPIVKTFEKSKIKQEVRIKTEDTKQKLEKFTKDTLAKIKNQITPTAVPEPSIVNMYKNNYQKHLNSIITDPSKSKNLFNNNQLEKEIMDRQYLDNVRYGRFDKRGDDVMNRTDFKRNVDSEKYLADIAEDNSVIIDIGSALGNNDPKLSGVSVFELASNPKIKQKNVHVIATDIASGVKDFKTHVKNKTAYDIDYAEVPMNFKTPISKILKDKKLSDKENIYLRTANSIDLLMNVDQAKEHLNHIAKSLKEKTVTYLYNNVILYKPKGKTTFQKLGNINNAGYDHNNKSWLTNKNRTPYKLTKPPLR